MRANDSPLASASRTAGCGWEHKGGSTWSRRGANRCSVLSTHALSLVTPYLPSVPTA